jgi:hypothetical protein
MSSITIGLIVFACVFGGSLLGMALRAVVPEHHLDKDSKDVVKLGMGLVGTMAALVLALLLASAKESYDAQSTELTQASASIVVLDRMLAHYGPETAEAREMLRGAVARALDRMWPKDHGGPSQAEPASSVNERLYEAIQGLSPKDDTQRLLKSQALEMAMGLAQTRWLMYEQQTASVSNALVIVMIFWLTIVFVSWGLFAPSNGTVIATFLVAALSVSGAIFLILEMYDPYGGLIRMSSAPLQAALAHLGQ